MKAAVVTSVNNLVFEELEVPRPGPGEVLVRMAATGVCHTDLSVLQGNIPVPFPVVLGHEGAGIVTELGSGVETLSVGDHVVLSIVVSCGQCSRCLVGDLALCEQAATVAFGGTMPDGTTRLRSQSQEYNHFLCQSSFAEFSVVPARAAVRVRPDAPLDTISVLGCGAMTGIGAVFRRAQVRPGSSVVVIGAGGVGLAVVMAARAVGATKIIAVDVLTEKLDRAKDLGATHLVNSTIDDVVESVQLITGQGADYAFDAVGQEATLQAAFQAVRPGGEVIGIGLSHIGNVVKIDMISLMMQKRLTGTYAGSVNPQIDIPAAVELFMDGRLPLDRLVSQRYKLDDLPQAFEDMEAGRVGRGVVIFDTA